MATATMSTTMTRTAAMTRTIFITARQNIRRYSSASTSTRPWFVDPEPVSVFPQKQRPPHLPSILEELPQNLPNYLKNLYVTLLESPYLEPSTLRVGEPVTMPAGPPLEKSIPKGRRKRGRTWSGIGIDTEISGIWSWMLLAQVKEGTENRGSIEAVVRQVRKTLLESEFPPELPPNSRRQMHSGWALVDGGDFVVHVLSKKARERYFERPGEW